MPSGHCGIVAGIAIGAHHVEAGKELAEVGMSLKQAPVSGGFAVVDLETTGLYHRTDRVVEAAVVHVSAEGQVIKEFVTLINPGRDVGPTRIHGIRAADVLRAPVFADAAATLWQLLSGRILVAHNVPFDARFLEAEFGRCGARFPPPPVMCTMQLASSFLVPADVAWVSPRSVDTSP
jgi:DNA polymerase III epsilon subunit-like protein